MMTEFSQKHEKRILLIEDNSAHYRTIMRRLRDEGYVVELAKSYNEALQALTTRHYHVTIVDLFLVDPPIGEPEGMFIIEKISKSALGKVLPVIILTANPSFSTAQLAINDRMNVQAYIEKKTGYFPELLAELKLVFEQKIKIRFNLRYESSSGAKIQQIARDIFEAEAGKISADLESLTYQVRDLLGKVFYSADRLYIDVLKPGLTGAAVVQARPTRAGSVGQTYVVKIGRRDKISKEYQRYRKYVDGLLAGGAVTAVSRAITRDLSAIRYTFAQNDHGRALREFDSFYSDPDIQVEWITRSIWHFFEQTCSMLYDKKSRRHSSLPDLYYRAFQLPPERLIERIREQIPDFSPTSSELYHPMSSEPLINPLAWLDRHTSDCTMPVQYAITHGDLTGRNLMVDPVRSQSTRPESGYYKFWLIDFYRTYRSHILRDFVILETDIKYRLMSAPTLEEFILLEQILSGQREITAALPPHLRRAALTSLTLREISRSFLGLGSTEEKNKEYKLSLLMATLNVVRLKHIEPERKLHALLSASLICEELSSLV